MKWVWMVLKLVLGVLSAMDSTPRKKKEKARRNGTWLPSDFYI